MNRGWGIPILVFLLLSCDVSGVPQDNAVPHVYSWDAPTTFFDNSQLIPERDIQEWEIYASQDGNFEDNSVPVAILAALDNQGKCVTSFDLLKLSPYGVSPGWIIASKTVSIDNVGSTFSVSILWE